MDKVISFEEAIEQTEGLKRLLLLGNGFSIGAFPDIFPYGTLFEKADFTETQEIPDVFQSLSTIDFEEVINALQNTASILPIYDGQTQATATIANHANALKKILVDTVANNHPPDPSNVTSSQFSACKSFLRYFISEGSKGKVYSLNYDLLLYWVLMHEEGSERDKVSLAKNDGFGRDEDTIDTDYVLWLGETRSNSQTIHYLHGALHLFDTGPELYKYTWIKTGIPLIQQIRLALDEDKYPLFVSEGTPEQKLTKIKHSAYLFHSFKSFSSELSSTKGYKNKCLFIYGHSLAESDNHILKLISHGTIPEVFISLNGDMNSARNREKIGVAENLKISRNSKYTLKITYYDSASANVWGEN